MNYRYYKPIHKLSEYVQTVLVFDNHPDSESSELPLFTNGMSALLCKANNHITLYGQAVPDNVLTPDCSGENKEAIISIFFKPFAVGTIFKLSAQNLKRKPIELNHWNAQKAMTLNGQLCHSKSTEEKVELLNQFIYTQTQDNQRDCEMIRYATDTIMQNSNGNVLSQIRKDLSLTERTFQRIFKKYVGITANEYRRICQYYFAFSQLKGGHFNKLTDVVYRNGYFDQSHYIRSFKEFANKTPNEYLQSGLDNGN